MKLTPFDAAKYLKTNAEQVEALTNAYATGEAGTIDAALAAVQRARTKGR